MIREFEFLDQARITILSERSRHAPFGLGGRGSEEKGRNYINNQCIAGKVSLSVQSEDCVRIETPGGGAFGYLDEK